MTSLRVNPGPSGAQTWNQLVDFYGLETTVESSVFDGWVPILDETLRQLWKTYFFDNGGEIGQIKEEDAVLRVILEMPAGSLDYAQERWTRIVAGAEEQSQTVCEWCGRQPATKVRLTEPNGWWKTLCSDECRQDVLRFLDAPGPLPSNRDARHP